MGGHTSRHVPSEQRLPEEQVVEEVVGWLNLSPNGEDARYTHAARSVQLPSAQRRGRLAGQLRKGKGC